MRLFVSVEPSPAARTALAGALDRLDVRPARLVSPERWHVTLAFLGDVAADGAPPLCARLAEVAAVSRPMQLTLSGAGLFPSKARPSVLWVGVAGDVEPLRRLAGTVAESMRLAGVELERRKFAPHLTIARYRNAPASSATTTVAELSQYDGPPFAVSELHLMRSHLGPHPRHEAVGTWSLGQSTPDAAAGSPM